MSLSLEQYMSLQDQIEPRKSGRGSSAKERTSTTPERTSTGAVRTSTTPQRTSTGAERTSTTVERTSTTVERTSTSAERANSIDSSRFGPDCTCEANLFYKQYRDQIESVLQKHAAGDLQGRMKKKGLKSLTQGQSVSFKHGLGLGTGGDAYSSDENLKEEQSKDEICASTWDDLQKIGLGKKSADIDYFLKQLSKRMDRDLLEGEGEGMEMTERGYYIFERFTVTSELAGTVCKISTVPSSVEEEGFYSYVPYGEEDYMSESMRRALEYLNRHHIADLFKYMGAQLVSNKPCNPIDFLINLLDHCMNYRAGYCQPPLLYMPKHIESLFNSMDPMKTGEIDVNQYYTAMFTLGIKNYNHFPDLNSNHMVDKETFLNEAFLRLKIQLDEMIKSDEPTIISGYTAYYPSIHGESVK